MQNQEISKRKIVYLSILGGSIVLVLVLLFTPIGFILGEMVLLPILFGVDPTGRWIVFAAIVLPLLWWLWGLRKNKT